MNNKLKIIIVFFLLIVVGVLCYYLYKNKERNVIVAPLAVHNIKKEYEEKDYVFDTDYSHDSIAFPYINLDYNNVRIINFRIKNIYDDNKDSITSVSYRNYINDDILSIVIDVILNEKNVYYTYNINMENGKDVLFDDVYYKYNQTEYDIKNKLSNYIENNKELNSKIDEIITKEYIVDNSIKTYKNNALSNDVEFYLDGSNSLNLVMKIEVNEDYYEYAILAM